MGEWIEIMGTAALNAGRGVSPFMGEWIEITLKQGYLVGNPIVSPFMGEWIEIRKNAEQEFWNKVSPFMGEWIEITSATQQHLSHRSHPSWVSGLKFQCKYL